MSLQTFSQHYRQRIDDLLLQKIETLPDLSPRLKAAMRHVLVLGGKRVRPFLVYATGSMLDVDEALLDGPAAAIECIHAYSLIHDDLPAMDEMMICGAVIRLYIKRLMKRQPYWQVMPCRHWHSLFWRITPSRMHYAPSK